MACGALLGLLVKISLARGYLLGIPVTSAARRLGREKFAAQRAALAENGMKSYQSGGLSAPRGLRSVGRGGQPAALTPAPASQGCQTRGLAAASYC
jgi:hypothetical protein